MGNLRVTVNYPEMLCRLIAVRNSCRRLLDECDKIQEELDKAVIVNTQQGEE